MSTAQTGILGASSLSLADRSERSLHQRLEYVVAARGHSNSKHDLILVAPGPGALINHELEERAAGRLSSDKIRYLSVRTLSSGKTELDPMEPNSARCGVLTPKELVKLHQAPGPSRGR
jgi:hypothetical protein